MKFCTNCGAHQWREGTDKMGVEQLKAVADDEFRQGKLGKSEASRNNSRISCSVTKSSKGYIGT